jgi:hypothetical protein
MLALLSSMYSSHVSVKPTSCFEALAAVENMAAMEELLAWSSSMSCTLVAEWLLLFHESCLAVGLVTKNALFDVAGPRKIRSLAGIKTLGG